MARIQQTTNVNDWKHVPTLENPADFISWRLTEEVGESAAVLVGTTVDSTVSRFKTFSKGRGND